MITRLYSHRIVTPQGFLDGYVYFENGVITAVTQDNLPFHREISYENEILCPGFIDLHVHGGNGVDFCSCAPDQVPVAADFHLRHGTTTIVPTVTSVTFDAMEKALSNIRSAKNQGLCKGTIAGVHLEGPYFSPAQCGAQNPDKLSAPKKEDYEALLANYGDILRRWSYAPELDKDLSFTKSLQRHGVIASMGHTDAIYDDCIAAFDAGCRLVTHLYSCTSTITREKGYRRLGVVETAYLLPDMDAEIIADGSHLPPELIRLIFQIKGADHLCLVTDAMQVAGTTATQSEIGGVPCIIEDGVAKLPDRSAFAGSVATTDRLLRVCVEQADLPLLDAVKMLTATPARILGIQAGNIAPGYAADFAILDDSLEITAVIAQGETVK